MELPITGLVEEFKCTKARLVMTPTESEDAASHTAAPWEAAGKRGLNQKLFRVLSLCFTSEMWSDRRQEEGERHAKAVSMAKQGRWTNWEGLEKKKAQLA